MLVTSPEGIKKFADAMSTAKILAVDTETTNNVSTEEKTSSSSLWDGRNWLMGISVAFKYQDEIWSCYFPLRHETGNIQRQTFGPVQSLLESRPVIFHNAKFDLASLASAGIKVGGDIYDTQVMAHLVNEEFPSKELDWLSKTILKDSKDKDRVLDWAKAFGWSTIPPEVMAPYAAHDAALTLRLFHVFYNEMKAA